jgi:hypothetical protein
VRSALTGQESGNTNTLPHQDHLALTIHVGKTKTTTPDTMTVANLANPPAPPTMTEEDLDRLESPADETDIATEAGHAIGLENETETEIATDTGSARRMAATEEAVLPTTAVAVAESNASAIDLDLDHTPAPLSATALEAVGPQIVPLLAHHPLLRQRDHSLEAAPHVPNSTTSRESTVNHHRQRPSRRTPWMWTTTRATRTRSCVG